MCQRECGSAEIVFLCALIASTHPVHIDISFSPLLSIPCCTSHTFCTKSWHIVKYKTHTPQLITHHTLQKILSTYTPHHSNPLKKLQQGNMCLSDTYQSEPPPKLLQLCPFLKLSTVCNTHRAVYHTPILYGIQKNTQIIMPSQTDVAL